MDDPDRSRGWFEGVDFDDDDAVRAAVMDRSARRPDAWPDRAVEAGVFEDRDAYYAQLHETTTAVARAVVRDRGGAVAQQLIHCVRALDDVERVTNELAERVAEWAGTVTEDAGTGVGAARAIAEDGGVGGDGGPMSEQLRGLAARVVALDDEATALRRTLERAVPDVAPNLAMLAGPVLAARLIALAGGLASLAKKPSGTIQVLGAEDALFAHLSGRGSSPKHGVIYGHEYVSGTAPEHRGAAARVLAGKLAIAARIDHYAGDRRPELQSALDERIAHVRERGA